MPISLGLVFTAALSATSPAAWDTAKSAADDAAAPTVVVHRAYRYAGKGPLPPGPGRQLVAIEVEFPGGEAGLDLDDVEILDGATSRLIESAPEVAFLEPDGTFYAWRKAPPSELKRCLLVFEVPSKVKSVHLQLDGDILTKTPIPIRPTGPVLPDENPASSSALKRPR